MSRVTFICLMKIRKQFASTMVHLQDLTFCVTIIIKIKPNKNRNDSLFIANNRAGFSIGLYTIAIEPPLGCHATTARVGPLSGL